MNTEQVIYNMLIENTGIHMLDSGMANGRHWQQNQLKTIDDFRAEDHVKYDPDYGVILSLFHHLNESLSFNKELNDELDLFLTDTPNGYSTTESITNFLDERFPEYRTNFENSYNSDNVLSQNILFAWSGDLYDNDHVALSIHNGADVEEIEQTLPFLNYPDRFSELWCCASSWRPHKRLDDNIEYFFEHAPDDACLLVAGKVHNRSNHPNVFYLGEVEQHVLYRVYKAATHFIHLAWLGLVGSLLWIATIICIAYFIVVFKYV